MLLCFVSKVDGLNTYLLMLSQYIVGYVDSQYNAVPDPISFLSSYKTMVAFVVSASAASAYVPICPASFIILV